MGRPLGSKNKPPVATSRASKPSASGARKAVKTQPAPTNFADTSLGAGTDAGSKARATAAARTRTPSRRTSSRSTGRPDWSTLRYGILLGETKAIKKAFASQDEALVYVKGLPVAKQSKAKLVTVQALKVETSISILPVCAMADTVLTDMHPAQTIQRAVAVRASNAPAVTAAINKATDATPQTATRHAAKPAPVAAPKAAAPVAKPTLNPVGAFAQPAGRAAKNSRLDLIAARAAKLGHTSRGSAKADVIAVAATELAVEDPEEAPEEDAVDLSAADE